MYPYLQRTAVWVHMLVAWRACDAVGALRPPQLVIHDVHPGSSPSDTMPISPASIGEIYPFIDFDRRQSQVGRYIMMLSVRSSTLLPSQPSPPVTLSCSPAIQNYFLVIFSHLIADAQRASSCPAISLLRPGHSRFSHRDTFT